MQRHDATVGRVASSLERRLAAPFPEPPELSARSGGAASGRGLTARYGLQIEGFHAYQLLIVGVILATQVDSYPLVAVTAAG